jgi:hypothetical protein
MKNLVTLFIVGAFVVLGGVYFELWKIPQLANFPTISSRSEDEKPSLESAARKRMNQDAEQAPPGGPLAPNNANSARAKQLQDARSQLGN